MTRIPQPWAEDRARWDRLRLIVLEEAGYQCEKCGRVGRLEVDHVRPRRVAPELAWERSNLQALCRPCHFAKTATENAKRRERKPTGWDALVEEAAA